MAGEVTFELDQATLAALRERLAGIKGGIGRAIAGAANKTADKIRVQISKRIRDRIPIKKRDIDRFITVKRAVSTDHSPVATVRLSKSQRIPLQYFGARQIGASTRKRQLAKQTGMKLRGASNIAGGVVYTIGKKFVEGAFMGPRPGVAATKLHGGVFIRTGYPGQKARLPIRKLKGPSPWGVFVLSGAMEETLLDAKAEMDKQLLIYVNYLLLKQSGAI